MRVAFAVHGVGGDSGGFAVSVPELARALAAEGVQVELHATSPVPEIAGVEVRASPRARPWRLGRSPGLRDTLSGSAADLFHAHGVWMLPLRYAAEAARRRGVPLVLSPRGMLLPWSLGRRRWRKAVAERVVHPGALAGAAGWHATSELEAKAIEALGFASPICVAPNGATPLPSEEEVRAHYAPLLETFGGRRRLLFYSRFHSKKRPLELLRDFAGLGPSAEGWQLLMVGIPEELGVDRLEAAAVALGISERVTVLDGRGAPAPYAVADLFVLPSHSENFGQVVVEALSCGVPVLTTHGTPWSELRDAGAGECVSLAALPVRLAAWMARPREELRAAGARGRAWCQARFDWRRSARLLIAFYEDLLARRDRSSRAFRTLNSS